MPVVDVREIWEERQADVAENHVRTARRVWRLRTDSQAVGPGEVIAYVPVVRGQFYVEPGGFVDLTMRAVTITASPDQDDPLTWRAVVGYTSGELQRQDGRGRDPAEVPENPLLRPPDISIDFEDYRRPVEKCDITYPDGNTAVAVPPRNSAGFPFDPPVEMDDARAVITYERNVLIPLSLAAMVTYTNSVNSEPWNGFEAGQVKARVSRRLHFENGISFWRETFKFSCRQEGWHLFVLDAGFMRINAISGDVQRIVDADGKEISDPWPLNGSGEKVDDPSQDDPTFLELTAYREVDFNDLGIVL